MPSSNPVEERVSHDRNHQPERDRETLKREPGEDEAAGQPGPHDTDPDSPNADINRDDMNDEP